MVLSASPKQNGSFTTNIEPFDTTTSTQNHKLKLRFTFLLVLASYSNN